jgi:hypothetical protein
MAAEVQEISTGLVNKWGKQRGAPAVKEEQRGSERFFSKTFERMPRVQRSAARCIYSSHVRAPVRVHSKLCLSWRWL